MRLRWAIAGLLWGTIAIFLTACSLPQVSAAERTFLPLSIELIGETQIPKTSFVDTTVGGLSAITYDRSRDRFYALSDDRGETTPARFYTLKLNLEPNPEGKKLEITLEKVTTLKDTDGNPLAPHRIDPEGLVLTPQQTVIISSEGEINAQLPPSIQEFDLETGKLLKTLPIPKRYLPETKDGKPQGIQNNFGFEALATNPIGTVPAAGEPLRLFTATESALLQDLDDNNEPESVTKIRWLHYVLSDAPPLLLSEHFYQLDVPPLGTVIHGLTEMVALDQGGHFLTLERSLGLRGFSIKLFQAAMGGASDTSGVTSLKGSTLGLNPIQKQLLLDLNQLGIPLDNLEGMTLGPRLADGSQSLILVSDDNFRPDQVTQVLLFRLKRSKV